MQLLSSDPCPDSAQDMPTARRKRLQHQLEEARSDINSKMRIGCTREQFECWQTLLVAIDAAQSAIESIETV